LIDGDIVDSRVQAPLHEGTCVRRETIPPNAVKLAYKRTAKISLFFVSGRLRVIPTIEVWITRNPYPWTVQFFRQTSSRYVQVPFKTVLTVLYPPTGRRRVTNKAQTSMTSVSWDEAGRALQPV
jgi:hypothetical protein